MQRWKIAVGFTVLLVLTNLSLVACSKNTAAKQDAATEAKAKPDAKNAKKPAVKPGQKTANATKTPAPAGKPAQTASAATKTTQSGPKEAQTAAKPSQPAAKPAQPAAKPAQNAANQTKVSAASAPKPAAPAAKPAPTPAQRAAAAAPTSKSASAKPSPQPAPKPVNVAEGVTETQQTLQNNKALVTQIQSRMPTGTDVVKAAAGFKNLNQFVAAVHASKNLNIPFDKLKIKMVDEKKTLSESIKALKPAASATIEAQRADYDARGTIYEAKQAQAAAPATATTSGGSKKAKPSPSGGTR
jgi:hypothetical protein